MLIWSLLPVMYLYAHNLSETAICIELWMAVPGSSFAIDLTNRLVPEMH